MFGIYTPFVLSIIILYFGIICYYVQKYEINEDNNLFKYRPNKNNILIKLKLFKYDWRFNYLLLIPYLISWSIFLITLILYIIYWVGGQYLINLFSNYWFHISLLVLIFLMLIYIAIIKEIINFYNGKTKSFTKEEKKLLKEVIKTEKDIKGKKK